MKPCSIARRSSFLLGASLALAIAIAIAIAAPTASAAILYQENFDDDTYAPNSADTLGTVINGQLVLDDQAAGNKARFAVTQVFDADVMTFSFDVVAPVTNPAPTSNNDLMLRTGIGTAADMPSSAEDILEAIVWRNGNRGSFANNANGTESIFVVANNKSTDLTFASPIDGTNVTLTGFQFIVYSRRNDNDQFGIVRGITTFLIPTGGTVPGDTNATRFAIGNSSNTMIGGTAIDNVAIVDEVSFVSVVPEPSALAWFGLGSLLAIRRRR